MERALPASAEARLADLSVLRGLDPAATAKLRGILIGLSAPEAPTAVSDPEEGVDIHLADALTAFDLDLFGTVGRVADIGSGCGIPGLVLAACLPSAEVMLVESIGRKCDFIDGLAARCGITNAKAIRSRAEEWSDGLGSCDVVTARALAPLPVLLEYAAPLLVNGGSLVAWKGAPDTTELSAGREAARELGMGDPMLIPAAPWPQSANRHLVVSSKTEATPDRFPRRAGMAVKRPLGG